MKTTPWEREQHKLVRRFRAWSIVVRKLDNRVKLYPEGFTKETVHRAGVSLMEEETINRFRDSILKAS